MVAKNKGHLKELIKERIDEFGNNCDLNDIDVKDVTDMSKLFEDSKFNGDISKWDVSGATDMYRMFSGSQFNGDISKWKVNCEFMISKNFDNYKFLPKNINGDIWFYYDIDPKTILPLCMCDIKGKWDYSDVKKQDLKKALSIMEHFYNKYGFGVKAMLGAKKTFLQEGITEYGDIK